jgi:hypothetical protein
VSNCFISFALTFELVFPENRLLSVLLSTLDLQAASETSRVSQERRNAIASSIACMVVEISRLEVVLMMDCGGVHRSGMCTVVGNLLSLSSIDDFNSKLNPPDVLGSFHLGLRDKAATICLKTKQTTGPMALSSNDRAPGVCMPTLPGAVAQRQVVP